MTTFSLITEPWIRTIDGKRYNLPDLFKDAHNIHFITDTRPFGVAGIFRLLAAILQDMLRPKTNSDIRRIWEEGAFDAELVDKFFEKYHNKFDLFSPTDPFFQDHRPTKPDKYVSFFDLENASQTGKIFSKPISKSGIYEKNQFYCPACCTAVLTTIPAFSGAGGSGYKAGINRSEPTYMIPFKDNLFKSLVLALVPTETASQGAGLIIDFDKEDEAWWHKPSPTEINQEELINFGLLESYTSMTRKVKLFPEESGGICTRCGEESDILVNRAFVNNHGKVRPKIDKLHIWTDPFSPYRYDAKKGETLEYQKVYDFNKHWFSVLGFFLNIEKKSVPPFLLRNLSRYSFLENKPISVRTIAIKVNKANILDTFDFTFEISPQFAESYESMFLTSKLLELKSTLEQAKYRIFEKLGKQIAGVGWKRYSRIIDKRFSQKIKPYFEAILLVSEYENLEEAMVSYKNKILADFKESVETEFETLPSNPKFTMFRVLATKELNKLYTRLTKDKENDRRK